MKTLVLGMGNPILRDDAVGIRLARDFRRIVDQTNGGPGAQSGVADVVIIDDCSVGGLNLLDLVTGYDRLVVFDSIRTPGGTPGRWYAMTGVTYRETMNLGCVHDANFTTALELGRQLQAHVPAPEHVHIFAVEIADNTTFSETMTPLLESAYGAIASQILQEALRLLLSFNSRED